MQIGVPSGVTDEDLKQVATFRSRSRIPVIVCVQIEYPSFIVILPNGLVFAQQSFRIGYKPRTRDIPEPAPRANVAHKSEGIG